MKTEVISFRRNQTYGEITMTERFKAAGRVSEIRIRFYPGQERNLKIQPYVKHKGNRREDLITYVNSVFNANGVPISSGDNYLTGDNDYFIFPCSVDFDIDDEMVIYSFNSESTYVYTVVVDVVVNYFEDEVKM